MVLAAYGLYLQAPPRSLPEKKFQGVILSEKSDEVLRRACFDCHSNETIYPWYSYLPVIRPMIDGHIDEGRKVLNFSEWGDMAQGERISAIEESMEEIYSMTMPPENYLRLHWNAKISEQDFDQIQKSATGYVGSPPSE